jgi:hypothetical protein
MYVETLAELRGEEYEHWHEHQIIIAKEFRSHPRVKQLFNDMREYHRETVGSEKFAYTCICADDTGDVEVFLRYTFIAYKSHIVNMVTTAICELFHVSDATVRAYHTGDCYDMEGTGCRCPLL